MYLRELWMSLIRRWPLVVAALLLTAGACYGVATLVPAQYEAKASLVLLPPKSTQDPSANRYLLLDQLGQATGVLIRALNADETHRAVASASTGDSEYTVEPDYTTNAPILIISVSSPTAAGASELLAAVEDQVPSILTRLQDEVSIDEGARISAVPVTTSDAPQLDGKTQLRAVVATGVGLAVVLVLLIGALDGYLLRRTARQARGEDDDPPVDGATTPRGPSRPVDFARAERRTQSHPAESDPLRRTRLG